jgi:hypothetical protein
MGFLRRYSVHLGIVSMVLLVFGTLAPAGSPAQKLLFLLPAPVLGYTAYAAGQKMFTALQAVVSVGAVLAFFESVPSPLRYGLLVGCGLAGVAYLVSVDYIREDRWWPLGGVGIVVLSFGYSTSALAHPLLFNGLLGVGGILVAAYSALGYFHLRVKVAFIWLVLNVLFVINPLLTAASLLR